MLKRRLIPKLQMRATKIGKSARMVLVTTVRFGKTVEVGDPVSQAKIYEAQAADELIFLDLDASSENRGALAGVIARACEEIFMPITVGGGVGSVEDFRRLLQHGADKVSVNTAAVRTPDLINRASDLFGAQCVVLSMDYKTSESGVREIWINGGKENTGLDPVTWAVEGQQRGAGEILLTSMDRDGTRQGLDLEITRRVSEAVDIPVITSGGCGLASHFVDGFIQGKAHAVSAGTFFCFKDENPMQTRSRISNAGIPVRLHT